MGDLLFLNVVSGGDSISPLLGIVVGILVLIGFAGCLYLVAWGFFGDKSEIKKRQLAENPIVEDRDVLGLVKPMGNVESSFGFSPIDRDVKNANKSKEE